MTLRNNEISPDTDQPIKNRRGGWRFALFYFLSLAAVSVYGTYGSLYFKRRGVSNVQLGVLFAIPAWVGIFAPLLWGIISDALRQRKLPCFLMQLMTAIIFPLFWFWNGGSFVLLCLLMGFFTLFFRAGIPIVDAWTLDHIQRRGGDYGRIRSWGSAGFVVALLLSIFVLKKSSMLQARDLLPVFVIFCAFRVASSLYALTLPDYHSTGKRPKLNWGSLRVYLRPFALVFFFAVFMSRFLFAPYYTFFTIFLDQQGVPDNLKGIYWMVAVGAETGLIAVSGSLMKRLGAVPLLLAGLSAMALRMFVYSLEPGWYIILAMQSLHALTFGAFHVASIQIINRITPQEFRASGQTFNAALLGVGGMLGSAIGGACSQAYGLVGMFRIFSITAAGTVILITMLFLVFRENGIAD